MARRRERPSVKGKGRDIFFGADEVPEESKLASLQASTDAETDPASTDLDLLLLDAVIGRTLSAGRITASFRFSESELDSLDAIAHEAKTSYGVRIPKQDLVRVGVAALISEYEERGDTSLLARYIAWRLSKQ